MKVNRKIQPTTIETADVKSYGVDWSKLIIMDWKVFLTIFAAVFIAELGDKTQLATMLFATDKEVSKYTIFLAASAALIVATALGCFSGDPIV